jgi:pimeloyl-ACP methyl ester carboxylesterase
MADLHSIISKDTFPGTKCDGTYYYLTPLQEKTHPPLVILIHGMGAGTYNYNSLSMCLESAGFRVLMYDLIGRGWSDYPSSAVFDGPAHVNQLRTLLSNLRAQGLQIPVQYHVIGHSQGGAVAALYVSQYAEEVRSVVFLAPAGLMNSAIVRLGRCLLPCLKSLPMPNMDKKKIRKFVRKEFPGRGRELDSKSQLILEEAVRGFEQNSKDNPKHFIAMWNCVGQFPLYGLDREVGIIGANGAVSTLVMWAKKDNAVPFNPSFNRWKKYLGSPTVEEDVTSTVGSRDVDQTAAASRDADQRAFTALMPDRTGAKGKAKKIVRYKVYDDDLRHAFFMVKPDLVQPDILSFLKDVEAMKSVLDADCA